MMMKTLLLLALVGFVLAVPFSEDEFEAQSNKLKGIADEFTDDIEPENPESEYDMGTEDEEEFDEEDPGDDNSDKDEDEIDDEDDKYDGTAVQDPGDDNSEEDAGDDGTAVKRLADPQFFRRRFGRRRFTRRRSFPRRRFTRRRFIASRRRFRFRG